MTVDVTALNTPPTTTTIMLGTPVQCLDGPAGVVEGIVINPSTATFEYLMVRANDDHPHFVPRGQIAEFTNPLELSMACESLQHQPEPHQHDAREAGLLTSHLDNLCIATGETPVMMIDDSQLGNFAGVAIAQQLDYAVRELLIDGDETQRVDVLRFDPSADHALRVITPGAREAQA